MAGELIAVENDPNTHGGGGLIPANPQTIFIEGKPIIEHGDPAQPDSLCPLPPHCNPDTANGSSSVSVYGNPIHRNNDGRVCGAKTIVNNQSSVWAG